MDGNQFDALYKERIAFLEKTKNDKNSEFAEMAELKSNYTFHSLPLEGSEPWFDLFKKPFIKHPAKAIK